MSRVAKLILNPTSSTRREIALNRSLLSIGRDPSNDLVLPDAMVSRRHAVIEYRGSQYYLRDCNSSNGSVVNGDRVEERNLRDGDLVAIGTARLLFREDLPEAGAKVVPHPSAPRLECSSCQAEYRKGDLFCRECGTAIAPSGPPRVVCAFCGTAVRLPARFCNACGSPLTPDRQRVEAAKPAAEPPPAPAPALTPAPEPPASSLLPPLESDEPPTRPTGPAPVVDPPPSDPRGGRFQASAEGALRGGASGSVMATAPAFPPPSVPLPRPARPTPRREDKASALRPAEPPRAGNKGAPPADFGRRLLAGLLDVLAVLAGEALLLGPLTYYWWSRDLSEVSFLPVLASVTLSVVGLVLGAAYFVGFWGLRGATPGKELLGLRVTDEDGRSPIGLGQAALRFLGYLLSAASLGIGFLMIAAGGHALHDRVARTRVVRGEMGKA